MTVRVSAVSAPGAAPEADVPYALSGYGLAKSDNVPNLKPCEQGPSSIRVGGESRACRISKAHARRVQIWALKWAS